MIYRNFDVLISIFVKNYCNVSGFYKVYSTFKIFYTFKNLYDLCISLTYINHEPH